MINFDVDNNEVYDYSGSSMTENREFLYGLVKDIKPKFIVELGSYYGCSYFSFAQSIKDNKLSTRLCGIDTWAGDVNTGFYDNKVFKHFIDMKRFYFPDIEQYGYMKTTFENAVDKIPDRSVDILMIDGTHTFEAVKQDYFSYLPKLAKNGVVLFHDVNVQSFGVRKFWGAISARHPHYKFENKNGLGVLFPKGSYHNLRLMRKEFYSKHTGIDLESETNKVCVYSAIYGGKDRIFSQQSQTIPNDFVMFTDDQEMQRKYGEWNIVHKDIKEKTPRMKAKRTKILPWEYEELAQYDYSIWIDGHIKILSDNFLEFAMEQVKETGFALLVHPDRKCVWDEFQAVIDHGKFEGTKPPTHYLDHLKQVGYPKRNGLYAGTVLIRDMRNKKVQEVCKTWWKLIKKYSFRDQLTLPYAFYLENFKPTVINENLWKNPYFKYNRHAK